MEKVNPQEVIDNVEIGEILVGEFGYSMVLYDFYEVVGKTQCSLRVRKLKKKYLGNDLANLPVCPLVGQYDESEKPMLKKVSPYGYIKISNSKYVNVLRPYNPNKGYYEDHMD